MAVELLIIVAPLPVWTLRWFAYFQAPVVVFPFVCYLGKLLPVLARVWRVIPQPLLAVREGKE